MYANSSVGPDRHVHQRRRSESSKVHGSYRHRMSKCADLNHTAWMRRLIFARCAYMKNIWVVRKRTFLYVRSTKTRISMRIRTVWSESPLTAWRHPASLDIQNAPSKDSDSTARKRRLIWIFAGAHVRRYDFRRLGTFLVANHLQTGTYLAGDQIHGGAEIH